jgi:hypothetical protein
MERLFPSPISRRMVWWWLLPVPVGLLLGATVHAPVALGPGDPFWRVVGAASGGLVGLVAALWLRFWVHGRRRQRWALALTGPALACMALATVAVMLWPWPSRITRENCQRICQGMNRAEVEAILGPPADYSTGPVDFRPPSHTWPSKNPVTGEAMPVFEHIMGRWETDTGTAVVVQDEAGRAVMCSYYPCLRTDQSVWDTFAWRAKRQWHRWFP